MATVDTPIITPIAGPYKNSISVALSCRTPDVNIYYTTDGSTPDETDNLYVNGSPIVITSTTTIKAIGIKVAYWVNPTDGWTAIIDPFSCVIASAVEETLEYFETIGDGGFEVIIKVNTLPNPAYTEYTVDYGFGPISQPYEAIYAGFSWEVEDGTWYFTVGRHYDESGNASYKISVNTGTLKVVIVTAQNYYLKMIGNIDPQFWYSVDGIDWTQIDKTGDSSRTGTLRQVAKLFWEADAPQTVTLDSFEKN